LFIEAKDDGGGGDNWTTGAISHAKVQSNHHHQQTNNQFLLARRSKRGNGYGNVAGWPAGWLSVCHSRCCIKTTKPILKLFRPSDSPIIEAFGTPCTDTKLQGETLHRGC